MTTVFLAGHDNFGNRGCEALVRSISCIVREKIPDARFLTPSYAMSLDGAQWPEAAQNGIEFVQSAALPNRLKWWNRFRKRLPILEKLGRPSAPLPSHIEDAIRRSDILIMTGGDVISIDYELSSLYFFCSFIDLAKKLGKPVFLWGASVGPFTRSPHVEKIMQKHLKVYDYITVREAESANYLKSLGIEKVAQVADPAFMLKPEPFDLGDLMHAGEKGVVGINVSPLIRKYRVTEQSQADLDKDVIQFAKSLCERGYSVVFVPHVGPLDGSAWNNDYVYMKSLLDQYGLNHPHLRLAPANLNAAQLKYLLSQLRFFVGARTHATIGAMSMGVPTVSIAYSVKAKGINKDVFGDDRFVLNTPDVNEESLQRYFSLLENDEAGIRALLAATIPEVKKNAVKTMDTFEGLL